MSLQNGELFSFYLIIAWLSSKIQAKINSVDTGRKLNVHKTFRRRPGRLLNVLCTFNLCPMSTGKKNSQNKRWENKKETTQKNPKRIPEIINLGRKNY